MDHKTFSNLQARFPWASSDHICEMLCKYDGHGGAVARELAVENARMLEEEGASQQNVVEVHIMSISGECLCILPRPRNDTVRALMAATASALQTEDVKLLMGTQELLYADSLPFTEAHAETPMILTVVKGMSAEQRAEEFRRRKLQEKMFSRKLT